MQIRRIRIENVGVVERLHVDLADGAGDARRRVVLVGENGSGKSTILDAIARAFASLTEAAGPDGHRDGAGVLELDVSLSTTNARLDGTLRFAVSEDGPRSSAGSPGTTAAARRARPPCVLLPDDRGVLEPSDLAFRQVVADHDALSRCSERFAAIAALLALAAVSLDTAEGRAVERMWKVLAKHLPELPLPLPQPDGLTPLRFRDARGRIVGIANLSRGERAILLLFGELALRSPKDGVVLIDELEQHLHPRWQKAVLTGLASLLPTAQFIITTQSPYLAACAPDDVVKLGEPREG